MNEQTTFLTPQGYQKLKEELDHLRTVRRKEVAHRLELAREEGDLLENAELEAALNEQSFVEGRILMLERMLHDVVIIEDTDEPHETVTVGCHVTITEGGGPLETYRVVGSAEADPTKGFISNESPLGQALMGQTVGDKVTVRAPGGELEFKIVGIQ
jgi:transcription elongation factor GreA